MQVQMIHRLFANRSIARQLVLLRNAVVFGFAMLAIAYATAVALQARAISINADIDEFRKTTLEIQADMLQARRNEKDFLLHHDEEYSIEYAKSMGQLYGKVDRAVAGAPDQELKDLIAQVQKSMRQYQAGFTKVLSTQQTMGVDEESGLQGTMVDAARKAESDLRAQRSDALLISLLQMRRHEKNFILRNDTDYIDKFVAEQHHLESLLLKSPVPAETRKAVAAHMNQYATAFRQYAGGAEQVDSYMSEMLDSVYLTESLLAKLQAESAARLAAANSSMNTTLHLLNVVFGLMLIVGLALVAGGLYLVTASIMRPIGRLSETVDRLAEGDDAARAGIADKNEFGHFGRAFDRMMDERVATQQAIQRENERLNESVLNLLHAVAQLARKDLTVKVPVTEDVTGPVADALNMLTTETGKVLLRVTDISTDVTEASLRVKEHTETVTRVAATGRHQADQTAQSLAAAAKSMNEIAGLAQECNASAERAISTTRQALEAVADTLGGINDARDTIRETEKRIKRLGERSQEISGVVNLINSIAERTHILALNASMHAASAGEAGRGFAVVAEEVQRLAENARQATAQIASLVSNIQVETSDTVTTMNSAISRVVQGAKLADQASDRMQQTESSTAELVSLVQRIAEDSREQAKVSSELLQRAAEIRTSTEETSRKVEEAGEYTRRLVEYARNLMGAVRVFKLPA
jgi:methyl-accepting chemotaxis protein